MMMQVRVFGLRTYAFALAGACTGVSRQPQQRFLTSCPVCIFKYCLCAQQAAPGLSCGIRSPAAPPDRPWGDFCALARPRAGGHDLHWPRARRRAHPAAVHLHCPLRLKLGPDSWAHGPEKKLAKKDMNLGTGAGRRRQRDWRLAAAQRDRLSGSGKSYFYGGGGPLCAATGRVPMSGAG